MRPIPCTDLAKMTPEERKKLQDRAPEYQAASRTHDELMAQRLAELNAIKLAREAQPVLDGVIQEIKKRFKK